MEYYQAIIVDDEYENRYSFDLAFQKMHWSDDVKILDSAERLLKYLQSLPSSCHYPLLIVLSYDIQKRSGGHVLATLRQHDDFKVIPVVVYTSTLSPLLNDKLLSTGALACYEKGADHEQTLQLAKKLKALAATLAEVPKRY